MPRALRILLWLLGLAAFAVVLAVGAFYLAPSKTIAAYLADKVRDATGRELVVEGDIERELFPRLTLATGRVTLSNAPWAGDEPLFEAAAMRISTSIWPLLTGALDLDEITLDSPMLSLEINEDGVGNYQFASVDAAPESDDDAVGTPAIETVEGENGEFGFDLSVVEARIVDGALRYRDNRTGHVSEVSAVRLNLGLEGLSETLRLEGSATVNDREITAQGEVQSLASLRSQGEVEATVSMAAEGVLFDFTGALDVLAWAGQPAANGFFSLVLSDDPTESAWLRSALPPELAPLGAVDVSGAIDVSAAAFVADVEGFVDFNDERTELHVKGSADEGWMQGRQTADLDVALKNAFLDIGYVGAVGRLPGADAVSADGAYRVAIPDVTALARWAQPLDYARGAPPPLLERVDLSGQVSILDRKIDGVLTGDVAYNRQVVVVDAQASGGADWRLGEPVTSAISLWSQSLGRASWSGEAVFMEDGPHVAGAVELVSPDVTLLRSWIGFALLKRDYGELAFGGDLVASPSAASFQNGSLTLGGAVMRIAATADGLDQRPHVKAEINGGPFDLTPVLFDARSEAERQARTLEPWSEAPFGHQVLRDFDADIVLDLDGFRMNDLELGRTRVSSSLKDGEATVALERFELYQGRALGSARLDANGDKLGVTLDLNVTQVQLAPFLKGVGRDKLMRGVANAQVALAAAGEHLSGLISSTTGRGRVDLRQGAVLVVDFRELDLDILETLGARQPQPGVTPFDLASASFTVTGGQMRNRDLQFRGPVISAIGEGVIRLGAQTLDYVVTAVQFGEVSSGFDRLIGRSNPIAIRGPWLSPTVGLAR